MPTLHAPSTSTMPVFTDPTGRRARVLRRLSWAVCSVFALVVGSVVFSLVTQVPLPGLGGLLPDRPDASAPRATPAEKAATPRQDDARLATVTSSVGAAGADAGVGRSVVRQPQSAAAQAGGTTSTSTANPAAPASSNSGTPSGNANPQSTTKVRNPKAAPKKPSPRAVKEPNEHAATGQAQAATTRDASTAPGRNK